MPSLRVAIIGAGVGGLAAAARLAHLGFQVEVFERAPGPGGRCGRVELAGFTFDLGPTLLLMPEVLEETFAAAGRRVQDYLSLSRCDPNYRIHYRDGSSLTLQSDLTKLGPELERLEPGSFARALDLLALGREQYQTSLERFVGRNFDGVGEFLTPANVRKILAVRALRKLYPVVSRYFRDERLRAAFTFQTMYLGLSPFAAPAVYGLLPFTELGQGIWFPKGGLHEVALALERVAGECGARFHYGAEVRRIVVEEGRAKGLQLSSGERIEADVVLCNADLPWAYRNLLDPGEVPLRRAAKLRYTSSAFMLYLGVRRKVPQLLHHNVFFGDDYRGSFDDLFRRFRVPDDPSFYVNVASSTDPSLAPKGCDGVYVLVPVPHRHPSLDWSFEGPKLRAKVVARLQSAGIDLDADVVAERRFTPEDWAGTLNLERGAAFGLSHDFFQVGPFRPANVDPKVPNLFFVGASTQPGAGLPMVMLSARLVTQRIRAFADQTQWPRVLPAARTEAA